MFFFYVVRPSTDVESQNVLCIYRNSYQNLLGKVEKGIKNSFSVANSVPNIKNYMSGNVFDDAFAKKSLKKL